jgi:hypothetical protein
LFTPQKFLTKNSLPPKPSTPKMTQKQNFSFENLQNTPVLPSFSPRNSTPIKHKTEKPTKTPLKSNNSSPSHRRSLDVLSSNLSEEGKKFQEHLLKIEGEKEKLKSELEILQVLSCENEQKLKKKDEKIRFLALLLKETELQFKTVLETTSKDLEKIIQDQALKIKELNEALKTQQKDLKLKWENEKNELAAQISLLEKLNTERLKSQAENFTEKINELSMSLEQLEFSNKRKESDLDFYLQKNGDDESFFLICGLALRVKNEISHLQGIIQSAANEQEVSLSKILMTPGEMTEKVSLSELPKTLQHCLLALQVIRTYISDLYAEKYGEICNIH